MAPLARKLLTLPGHESTAWCVAWHPSGRVLASASADRSVRLWEIYSPNSDVHFSTCRAVLEDAHKRAVRSLSFSPSGTLLATASFDSTISIWETNLTLQKDNNSCTSRDSPPSHSSEDQFIDEQSASIVRVATLEGHETEAKCVAWSPDGSMLATCSRDKTVWIWHYDDITLDCECLSVLQEHTQDIKMLRWHPDGEMLFSASYDETVRVWCDRGDDDDWYCADVLRSHESTVWALDFDPTGSLFVTCSADRSLCVWRYSRCAEKKFKLACRLKDAHARPILSVTWAIHGSYIASCSEDNSICIWQWDESNEKLNSFHKINDAHEGRDVNCVSWNPSPKQGYMLASCGDDGLVNIWDIGTIKNHNASLAVADTENENKNFK